MYKKDYKYIFYFIKNKNYSLIISVFILISKGIKIDIANRIKRFKVDK